MTSNQKNIIEFLKANFEKSSQEIFQESGLNISFATIKRILNKLVQENLLSVLGKGKSTKYKISDGFEVLSPVDIDEYYQKELDERKIKENFNFDLIPKTLTKINLFNDKGYMASFFRQIKIRVLTLTSRESNEKIKIYGGTDFKGASEPTGRQESSRDLSGVRDFRADIL